MPASDFGDLYETAGRQYNVDPGLLRAVVSVESGGDPRAVSNAGAQGVAQLMPATAASLGVQDPTVPAQAIPGAAKLLSENLDRYGNVTDALQAYHGGTNQANWGPKTQAYPGKVMAALQTTSPAPAAAAPPDAFSAAFGSALAASKSQGSAAGAPAAVPDAFSAAFGSALGKSTTAPSSQGAQSDYVDAGTPVGPHGAQWIRNLVADDPNKTYGNVLPFARDNATGAISLALPEMLKSPVRGVADLSEGAANAAQGYLQPDQLSPDAANALMTIAGTRLGGAQPSAGASNALIRDAREAPPAPGPVPSPVNQLTAPNSAPMPAPGLITPDAEPVPGAAGAASAPGQAGAGPQAPPVGSGSPAAAAPPGGATPAAALPPIPDRAPPKPLLPVVTKAQARAQADRIIAHFALGGPTEANLAELVPGSQPTLAQATGNPGIAALEKGYRSANPAFDNAYVGISDDAAAARLSALAGITGTPADIDAAQAARASSTAALRDQAFENKIPTDPSPVISVIDNILASPAGQRSAVTQTLSQIRARLSAPVGDGTYERMQTDPEQLYGIRQYIGDLMDKQNDEKAGQIASSQLMQVKSALDPVIEAGAPGFKNYVAEFSKQSQPIDAMSFLQKQNLTDGQGNITLAKLDSTIKAIQKKQSLGGINDASSVSDDQLQGLTTIRDDMRRSGVKPSSRIPGSDTFQNLSTNAITKTMGNPLVNIGLGAHAGINPLLGIPLAGVKMGADRLVSRGNRLLNEALQERLLNARVGANALTSKKP